MNNSCPLCGAAETHVFAALTAAELADLWRKCTGIATEDEFGKTPTIEYRHCQSCDFRYFSPLISGSEAFYRHLQEKPWYFANDKFEFGKAAALVAPTDSVLEIGAGKGVFPTRLSTKRYVGLEFSPQAVAMARERGIELRRESVEAHADRHSGQYDFVCTFQVLEHVSNPDSFIKAAITCLKPGGRLAISVPAIDGFLGMAVNAYMNLPPHHVSHWSDECLRQLAPRYGLTLEALLSETLMDEHVSWYLQTMILRFLRPAVSMVRTNRAFWLLFKLVDFFAMKIGPRFSHHLRPRGHTVLAVYRKG